jgi:RNA polymerase sigma-70 factor (ECF subfamily)
MQEGNDALVRQILRGNLDAYELLYHRYARLIRAICRDATGDLHQAQDLCQEVFLRGYRNLSALKEPEKFAAWLVGIARWVCQEWHRSRLRDRHQFVGDSPESEARTPDPVPQEDLDHVLATIARLPEIERLALHLFYLQENSVEDARAVLGLSRSGFYRVLDRARKHLRRLLPGSREVNR